MLVFVAHGVGKEKMKCWWRSRCYGGEECGREELCFPLHSHGFGFYFLFFKERMWETVLAFLFFLL